MAELEITFANFDTVCYSNQHNIIELIKHMVGVAVQININTQGIADAQKQIQDTNTKLDQTTEDAEAALQVGKNLNQAVSHNSFYIEQQEQLTSYFWNTELGKYIKDLEDQIKFNSTLITNLEDRVIELEKKVGI